MPGLFLCDNVQNQKSCLRKF